MHMSDPNTQDRERERVEALDDKHTVRRLKKKSSDCNSVKTFLKVSVSTTPNQIHNLGFSNTTD